MILRIFDDTCTVDCPLIAQEFRLAGHMLAADSGQIELVAINYTRCTPR